MWFETVRLTDFQWLELRATCVDEDAEGVEEPLGHRLATTCRANVPLNFTCREWQGDVAPAATTQLHYPANGQRHKEKARKDSLVSLSIFPRTKPSLQTL